MCPWTCLQHEQSVPSHFVARARENVSGATEESDFLPRMVYGEYLESLLESVAPPAASGTFQWIKDDAVKLEPQASGFRLTLKSGASINPKIAVLATGNNGVSKLRVPGLTDSSPFYASSPWAENAWRGVPSTGSVLLIGTGLTSVDVAVAFVHEGFTGQIHAVSRHGLGLNKAWHARTPCAWASTLMTMASCWKQPGSLPGHSM